MFEEKGGRDAAFFLILFAVAVLGFGGSLQYPLALLRAGGGGAALWFLWSRRQEAIPLSPYPLLVGGGVLLAFGHSFSSVYFWVSFQHALNIALAAILLAWAFRMFRRDPCRFWDAAAWAVAVLALVEVGIALSQRLHGGDLRPRGTFDNANYLSEFLVAGSVLCLSRWFWPDKTIRGGSLWGLGAILFLAAGFSLGGSRGVLLASVPAYGVLLVARYGLRKGGTIAAGLGLPVLLLLGVRAAGRFFSTDLFNYSRWIIWKSALRTFMEHPFGVGLGGFKYFWFATQSPVTGAFRRYGKFADTAHNEYLEVLSGLGIVGILLFLALLVYPLVLAIGSRKEIAPEQRPVAAGAAGVLVLSGAHALFNPNFHVFGIFFLDAAMLGALLSCLPSGSRPTWILPPWTRGVGMVLCAVLLGATFSTLAGVYRFDQGERRLQEGDLTGAKRSFASSISIDPFRSLYPDALSAVYYRTFLSETPYLGDPGKIPESMFEALHWEDRARQLSPRDLKYTLRLSHMFFDLLRLRKKRSDALMALLLADGSLRINPYGIEIRWHKADVLAFLGRREEALRELEAAVSVEPNFCRGYARLADLAGETDSVAADRWSRAEEECLRKAASRVLEENEKWLVEPPENR